LTISRVRAGLVVTVAVVSLMAGAQAAQACTEPTLGDLPARGQEKKLVRFKLTGLTPGSEYLLKVNGRERKSGIAATGDVSRRFRMPALGDSNRRVRVEVVVANDGCETSPWKLEEKMTYRPAPEPQLPKAQPQPVPTPAPEPAPSPSPSPPPAPDPPSPPSGTDSTPAPQPAVPKSVPKPVVPAPAAPAAPLATQPPREGKAWITPLDPYQKGDDAPLKLNKASLARTEQPSEIANSTAALIGLGGIFLLMVGGGAIGWSRFRRYDDDRLQVLENPDGKLPTHLDPKANDMVEGPPKKGSKLIPWRKRRAAEAPRRPAVPAPQAKDVAAAEANAVAVPEVKDVPEKQVKKGGMLLPWRKRRAREAGQRRGVLAHMSRQEKAKLSPEELQRLKDERREEWRRARKNRRKKILPTFDPTARPAEHATAAADQGANGKPSPTDVPPIPASPADGPSHANGAPPAGDAPPPEPANDPSPPPNGQPPAHHSYRAQVESELQRILDDAGLHTEVDGILSDAKKEAQRQGVPIDSELMLKALCDETNGTAKLSESARGELESRFKRIIAEERGERPSAGS
jgi:hypothetical protein